MHNKANMSRMNGAKVYIGKTECGTIPDNGKALSWVSIVCAKELTGTSVKIVVKAK